MSKYSLIIIALLLITSCRKKKDSEPASYDNLFVGSSAYDILSADKFTILNIDIQYMPGYQLDPATILNVKTFLDNICHKPGGINIVQSPAPSLGNTTMTADRLDSLRKIFQTFKTNGNQLALYVLVADTYDTSAKYSFSTSNTSLCLMGKGIADSSGGSGRVTRASLETSELEHQLGHLMGLVNKGTPMTAFHQDTTYGKHCINNNCLMYHFRRTGGFASAIDTIPLLDTNCINDLRAIGAK